MIEHQNVDTTMTKHQPLAWLCHHKDATADMLQWWHHRNMRPEYDTTQTRSQQQWHDDNNTMMPQWHHNNETITLTQQQRHCKQWHHHNMASTERCHKRSLIKTPQWQIRIVSHHTCTLLHWIVASNPVVLHRTCSISLFFYIYETLIRFKQVICE
jgi:hypothetical protein